MNIEQTEEIIQLIAWILVFVLAIWIGMIGYAGHKRVVDHFIKDSDANSVDKIDFTKIYQSRRSQSCYDNGLNGAPNAPEKVNIKKYLRDRASIAKRKRKCRR